MPPMKTPQLQTWLAGHDPLPIIPLRDQVVERLGHHPMSAYAESYWLGVIGPASLWALRRLTGWLEDSPDGYPLALGPMARELGLGAGTGRNSPLIRTLARLACFELAAARGDAFAVRLAMPPLARRHLVRLPGHLAERHRADTEAEARQRHHRTAGDPDVTRRPA